jgi:hypothetical protein
VQVLRHGVYVEPAGVKMSPDLDRFQMYQTITFTFEPAVGEAVRIIGTPGGSKRFTTILELEAQGQLYDGPRVDTVVIGDGETPLTQVSTILIKFSDPVAITIADIELTGGSGAVDMQDAMLLQADSRRAVLLALPQPLPVGAYELRLHCPSIVDDFGLPLMDDDTNPADALRTTVFEVVSFRLDGARGVLRNDLGDGGQRELARVVEEQVQGSQTRCLDRHVQLRFVGDDRAGLDVAQDLERLEVIDLGGQGDGPPLVGRQVDPDPGRAGEEQQPVARKRVLESQQRHG